MLKFIHYSLPFFLIHSLIDNGISTEGAKIIAEVLKTNKTLKQLNLNLNFVLILRAIQFAIYRLICYVMFLFSHSQIIGNQIGDEGARIIADALKENSTITKIELGDMQQQQQ